MQLLVPKDPDSHDLEIAPSAPPPAGTREVIFFPGVDGRVVRTQEETNTIAKRSLRCLRHSAAAELVGAQCSVVTYRKFTPIDEFGKYYEKPARYVGEDAKQFVSTILLPRLGLDGDAKPCAQEIINRLSCITFVTHSYGAIFAQQVANGLRSELAARNYEPSEITAIIHSGVVISTTGADIIDTKVPQFVALRLRATNDAEVIPVLNTLEKVADILKHVPGVRSLAQNYRELLKATGYDYRPDFDVKANARAALILAKMPDSITHVNHRGAEKTIDHTTGKSDGRSKLDAHHQLGMHCYVDRDAKPDDIHKKYIDLKLATLERAVHRTPRIASALELLGPRALLEAAPTGNHAADARGRTENKGIAM